MTLEYKYICDRCWKVLDINEPYGGKSTAVWTAPPLHREIMCSSCIRKYYPEYYNRIMIMNKMEKNRKKVSVNPDHGIGK